tara:strand:- start:8886 stop:10031 length:1146 start_codon:yes stop_codon:yes gene_type:complete
MQKRGKKAAINEETYMLIINIVIIIIVWGLIFNYIRSVGNNTLVGKIYLSKDIGLLTNTISFSPGNIFYTYSNFSNKLDITKYLYSFKDGYIRVKENEKDDQVSFSYAKDLSLENSFPNLIENPEEIHFIKTDNKFLIDYIESLAPWTKFGGGSFGGAGVTGTWTEEDNSGNPITTDWSLTSYLNQISCPNIKIKENMESQVIIIDPGHGKDPQIESDSDDFGLEFQNKKEAYITTQIADSLDYDKTRNYNTPLTMEKRKDSAKDAHTIISIHIGNYSNNYNTIKAFIPYKSNKFLQSRKLACNILNAFPSELKLDGIVIIPVDTSTLQENNPLQIINFEDKTTVLLEIGNINTEHGKNMFNQLSKISEGIYSGLTKYYSK